MRARKGYEPDKRKVSLSLSILLQSSCLRHALRLGSRFPLFQVTHCISREGVVKNGGRGGGENENEDKKG
jgi:hypothetical protein